MCNAPTSSKDVAARGRRAKKQPEKLEAPAGPVCHSLRGQRSPTSAQPKNENVYCSPERICLSFSQAS